MSNDSNTTLTDEATGDRQTNEELREEASDEDRGDEPADPDSEYEAGQKRPLDHGVKVRGKVKRGTDTRDQDELLIEGRGEDAEEAAADFEAALQAAEEQGWADRLRAMQPEESGDE